MGSHRMLMNKELIIEIWQNSLDQRHSIVLMGLINLKVHKECKDLSMLWIHTVEMVGQQPSQTNREFLLCKCLLKKIRKENLRSSMILSIKFLRLKTRKIIRKPLTKTTIWIKSLLTILENT